MKQSHSVMLYGTKKQYDMKISVILGEVMILELTEHLEKINLSKYEGRDRLEGNRILSDAITEFSYFKGFKCLSRVFLPSFNHTRGGYLTHVIDTPDHRYAVEISSSNRVKSLLKLEYAREQGYIPIWVRWNVRQRLPMPAGIHVIDLTQSW